MDEANDNEGLPLWQQHQSEEIMRVVTALRDGDLKPLAEYLSSGGLPSSPRETVAIPSWVAGEIVAMIKGEPWTWFRLHTVGRKPGEKGWTKEISAADRRWHIGYFAEKRTRELPRGSYEAAVQETMDKFSVGRTVVTEALTFVRKYLKETSLLSDEFKSEGGVGPDGWKILTARYSAD